MTHTKTTFEQRAHVALHDIPLQTNLKRGMNYFANARVTALAATGDPLGLRQRGKAIRDATIANIDVHLAKLAEMVEKNGGTVHWAADAAEARAIILAIAREENVKLVVKSKSMATEEIELNHMLAEHQIEVVETDLGEYVAQQAHEPPSHIIAPIVHKNKEQVAEVMSRAAGRPIPPDAIAINNFARQTLREKFLSAEMGISGANFAVAETGTITLVTNEGNGRMCTSAPRVHVAVMGADKVIPSMDDLPVLLSLLTRSATGQPISVYVSMLSGPRRAGDVDGPEKFHLVIMDNGRSHFFGTEYQEMLNCIRCGACLNVCPVYKSTGGHAYGACYSGPMGAVLMPGLGGLSDFGDLAHASSLCGACRDACPVMIDIPRMLVAWRREAPHPFIEKLVFRMTRTGMTNPLLYKLGVAFGRIGLRLFAKDGRVQGGPPVINRWTHGRDFPLIAKKTFRERWRDGIQDR
jgi:L-lactate dehydrogenase complex protein LldF